MFFLMGFLASIRSNCASGFAEASKLTDLCWYARGLTPLTDANGPNVDDLEELLESRGEQSSKQTYFEIEVFAEYGPWKRNSHHYRNALSSQHPPGFQ